MKKIIPYDKMDRFLLAHQNITRLLILLIGFGTLWIMARIDTAQSYKQTNVEATHQAEPSTDPYFRIELPFQGPAGTITFGEQPFPVPAVITGVVAHCSDTRNPCGAVELRLGNAAVPFQFGVLNIGQGVRLPGYDYLWWLDRSGQRERVTLKKTGAGTVTVLLTGRKIQ